MTFGLMLLASVLATAPTVDALESRLAARDAAIDAEWRNVADRSALDGKARAFRSKLRRAVGFDEIRRTPLNARTVGSKDYGAFRIEKVILESVPGAYVAALVFLPDEAKHKPPYAGFMFIPGHANEGKAEKTYLQTCELGARNGLAVITYDPLGQGERSQGSGFRSAEEHVRIGAYAALLGETTATYMMRDAVRVFDYFAARPDIDLDRLGVSGNSGGGTMSSYFMVVDDRVKAAAPSCYLSSVREHLLACGPQDAEQNFFDGVGWGFNHAAFVFSANCPVLINAAVEDFFQIEGSRSTFRLVRKVADRLGLPSDWYELTEAPGGHDMSKMHRERAVRFLLRHLTGERREVVETETTPFTRADWQVTPTGEVSEMPGFVPVYDELAKKFGVRDVTSARAAAKAVPFVRRELSDPACRDVVATLEGDVVRGKPTVLRLGGSRRTNEVTATLFADGKRYVKRPERKGKFSYYERRGDDEVVAVDFYVAGRSLAAFRAAEILTLAAELEKRTGCRPRLVAEGRFVLPAKFAVAADGAAFSGVTYVSEPKPWAEALRSRDYLSFADSGALDAGTDDAVAAEPAVLEPGGVEILVSSGPASLNEAVGEMKLLLGQVLGCSIPVVARPTAGKTTIYLGDNEWNRRAGLDVSGFARDEFRVVIDGKSIRIAGRDSRPDDSMWRNEERATQFGVYEFLERYAGVRFYFPGELGTIVPKSRRLTIAAADFRVKPDFLLRAYRFANGTLDPEILLPGQSPEETETVMTRRYRMQTVAVPANHGQLHAGFYHRFHKTHPEYFLLQEDGTRKVDEAATPPFCEKEHMCQSSAIWDEIYEDAKSYFRGEGPEKRGLYRRLHYDNYAWGRQASARKYYDVSPQDGIKECCCPLCQAAYDKSKKSFMSELMWGQIAKTANRLKAEGIPGYLSSEAYSRFVDVPKCEIPDNVMVQVCIPGPWTPVKNADGSSPDDLVRAWAKKVGRNVFLWAYAHKEGVGDRDHYRSAPDVPQLTPHAWGNLWQRLAPYCRGGFNQCDSDWWIYNYLNFYVFSRVSWDNAVDVNAVLDEHYDLMFGKAAQPMKVFYETLESKWNGGVVDRTFDMDEMGPLSGRAGWYQLWTRVYPPVVLDELDGLLRKAKALVPGKSIEARRIAFIRKALYDRLATRARREQERMSVARGDRMRKTVVSPNLVPKSERDFMLAKSGPDDRTGQSEKIVRADCRAGGKYRISMFVKLDDVRAPGRYGGMTVRYDDGKGWCFFTPNDPLHFGTTDRFYLEYEYRAPEKSTGSLSVRVDLSWAKSGRVSVDGFRIEEI